MTTRIFETAIGLCSLNWNEVGLTGFKLLADGPVTDPSLACPPTISALIQRVRQHLNGQWEDFSDVAFDFAKVSDFQRTVYEAALTVKAGSTRSYGWLAHAIGQPPGVSRAVGTALGQNPWPLLVPCHRFVGADGKMTGFSARGGIATKLRLLAIERVELFAQ